MSSKTQSDDYPSSTQVPIEKPFSDERGEITNILLKSISSVARITSSRGSIRANHYHLTDWHYSYIETGEILYFERSKDSNIIPDPVNFKAGTMFFTPPLVVHAMVFSEETIFYTFAKNIRTHNAHESDLVRVEFITAEIASRYLK
jgi:hypothetical protein